MKKVWQVLAVIFAVILLAKLLLSTIEPFIPTIICVGAMVVIIMGYMGKKRKW